MKKHPILAVLEAIRAKLPRNVSIILERILIGSLSKKLAARSSSPFDSAAYVRVRSTGVNSKKM